MRALLQRVDRCTVTVEGKYVSSIGPGILILLGIKKDDTEKDADSLAERCTAVRIFDDGEGKMNRSVRDTGGEIMVVSQFTLYGDTRKGNRPSYTDAAPSHIAEPLYEYFIRQVQNLAGTQKVASGVFRAFMNIELINNGPVTISIESKRQGSELLV